MIRESLSKRTKAYIHIYIQLKIFSMRYPMIIPDILPLTEFPISYV